MALTPTRGTTSPKPKLVPRTPDSLLERGIDVTAHVGHVTSQLDGLVTHLRAGLLSDHEVVDADSGVRRDGQLTARFHRRIIFPVRDPHVRVIGVYGLDVTGGTDSQQYLNTTGFRKGSPAYWLRTP